MHSHHLCLVVNGKKRSDEGSAMGLDNARSKKRRVSNRSRKTAVSKDGAPRPNLKTFTRRTSLIQTRRKR